MKNNKIKRSENWTNERDVEIGLEKEESKSPIIVDTNELTPLMKIPVSGRNRSRKSRSND